MVTRSLHSLMIFLGCASILCAQSLPGPFVPFDIQAGLPDNHIHDISQDSAGYVWIATGDGLVRLHGDWPEVFTLSNGLPGNDIRSMIHLPDASAWIVTSGPLAKMNPDQTFRQVSVPALREQRVFDAYLDADGDLWVMAEHQLVILEDENQKNLWTKEQLNIGENWAFASSWSGSGALIVSSNGLLHLTREGPVNRLDLDLHHLNTAALSHAVLHLDDLGYLLTSPELSETPFLFNSQLRPLPPSDLPPGLANRDMITILSPQPNLNLILHPHAVSIAWQTEAGSASSTVPHSPATFTGAFLDQQHNIWLATREQGAWMLSETFLSQKSNALSLQQRLESVISRPITAIDQIDNKLLLGSEDGKVYWDHEQNPQVWLLPDQRPVDQILGHAPYWLARSGTYLYLGREDREEITRIEVEGLTGIESIGPSYVSLTTYAQSHYFLPPERLEECFASYSPIDWLEQECEWVRLSFSLQAVMPRPGQFAITLDDRISFPPESGDRDLIDTDPMVQGQFTDLALWGQSTIIAGSGPDGIQIFDRSRDRVLFPEEFQWEYGNVKRVIADSANQRLLVLTNRGLVSFDHLPEPGVPYKGYLISTHAGLAPQTVSDVVVLDQEVMLLQNGMVSPVSLPNNPGPMPNTDISVKCLAWPGSGCQPLWTNSREIPRDSASMELQLVVNDLRALDNRRLEYRIQGGDWLPAPGGKVSLFAMPPGSYRLDSRLTLGDQVILESTGILTWTVQAPFYQSWWFVFLASILLVAMIWAGMNLYYSERDRKHLEALVEQRTQSLDESVKELKQKNEDLEQFAYITSHDLKSPLRGMIGHLQLIQRRYGMQLGEHGESFLDNAVGEAKRLYEMVNDLLDFATVGTEKMEKQNTSLNKLLEVVKQGLIVAMKEKHATVTYQDLPDVEVVPAQWEALFRNLIENGIKFNESPNPSISVEHKSMEGYWIFIVSDNGIGIDQRYVKKAFELYGRLHPEYPGTGIGLAICKRVVERHGGSIWVESAPWARHLFFLFPPQIIDFSDSSADERSSRHLPNKLPDLVVYM